jgi:hypothetical protein
MPRPGSVCETPFAPANFINRRSTNTKNGRPQELGARSRNGRRLRGVRYRELSARRRAQRLFGERDGDRLIVRAITNPKRIACGLDGRGGFKSVQQDRNGGLVAVDRHHAQSPVLVFRQEQPAVRGSHAVGSLDRPIGPDLHRRARFA